MLRHSANGRSGIDDDFDPEIQSYIGPEVRSLPSDQAILPSLSGILGGRQSQEHQTDFDAGYLVGDPTAASSGGRSSHGNGTVITRTSSPTHATSSRNTSPTISRQNPNLDRTRYSDRPSAWQPSRSEAPTRRASIDDGSAYHPPRVNSDPIVFPDTPQLMSIYPRRQSQSSEAPRPDAFPPSILVYNPPPAPPSSLLRPPSANQVPTLQTLQQLQPPMVHLSPPFVNEPHASPAPSILSVTEGLLSTPPNHPTGSLSSLRDDLDYTRKLGVSLSCVFHWGPGLNPIVAFTGGQPIARQHGRGGLRFGDASPSGWHPMTLDIGVNSPSSVLCINPFQSFPPHLPLSISPLFFSFYFRPLLLSLV